MYFVVWMSFIFIIMLQYFSISGYNPHLSTSESIGEPGDQLKYFL